MTLQRSRTRKKPEASTATESADTDSLATAASEGASAAKARASQLIATVQQGTHRSVYSSVYAISYGVVFASMIIGHLIPGGSVVRKALADGSEAAVKDFRKTRKSEDHADHAAGIPA